MRAPLASLALCIPAVLSLTAQAADKFTLTGIVYDAAGQPVPHARVWFSQEAGVLSAAANDQGQYRIEVESSGAYQLVAMAQGHAIGGNTGFIAGDAAIDVTLPAAETVTVEVIGPTSQPLSGARLVWLNVNGQFNVPVSALNTADFPPYRSGADGKLTLPPLPSGGFVRLRLTHFDHADLVVDYLPVREKQPALQMVAGQRVGGRVLTPEQEGIEGARVTLFQTGVNSQRDFATATTDREGFFHCRVPVGEYLVGVRHAEWASPPPSRVNVKEDEEAEAIVTMAAARRIEGRVELPDGKPAAGTYVAFLKEDTLYEETFTDAAGRFRLRVASPQGVLRVVPPRGYVTEQIAEIPVAMEQAGEVTLKPIRLRDVPRLTGKVLDASGAPVANAVFSTPKLEDPSRFLSQADGSFEFMPDHLPDERAVYFHVEHPQRLERAHFIADFTESQQVEVKLEPYDPAAPREDEAKEDEQIARPMLGKEAPALSIAQWFNGDARPLSSLKGKAVVLCFWGSFDDSPQGVDAVEELMLLHEVYGADDQVAIIAIHDATSTPEEVQAFIDATQAQFPIALDTQRFDTFMAYKVTYIPEFVLLDKQGKIRHRQPRDTLLENLKTLRRE